MVHRTEKVLEWYVYICELAWPLMHTIDLDTSEALRCARTMSLEFYFLLKSKIRKIYRVPFVLVLIHSRLRVLTAPQVPRPMKPEVGSTCHMSGHLSSIFLDSQLEPLDLQKINYFSSSKDHINHQADGLRRIRNTTYLK